jgi:hypothetical protein
MCNNVTSVLVLFVKYRTLRENLCLYYFHCDVTCPVFEETEYRTLRENLD